VQIVASQLAFLEPFGERRKILLYLGGKSGLIDGFCIKLLHSTQSAEKAVGKKERRGAFCSNWPARRYLYLCIFSMEVNYHSVSRSSCCNFHRCLLDRTRAKFSSHKSSPEWSQNAICWPYAKVSLKLEVFWVICMYKNHMSMIVHL